jgi:acetyl-CoA acetyltransferase
MTVPAQGSFYGAPWLAGMIGAEGISGPTISQACATSARVIADAAGEVEAGDGRRPKILCITADRTSNGPHLVYPDPGGPGGRPTGEDWVWDNFNRDPFGGNSMLETAENVAREGGFSTEAQHEVVLMRHAQYQEALANNSAFQRGYMITPIEINPSGRKPVATVTTDEGVFPDGGIPAQVAAGEADRTVTYGSQTYPADGTAGMVVTDRRSERWPRSGG